MGIQSGYTIEFAGEYSMIGPAGRSDRAGRSGKHPVRRLPDEKPRPVRSLKDDLITTDLPLSNTNNQEPDLKGSGLIADT
jgi:hypothetical protein